MREIKFRVWDRDYKRMHIVGEFHHDSLNIDEDNNIYYLNLQCMESSPHKGIASEHCAYRLMQYTGLKDKNGKEIYEGDIVKAYESNIICEVIFSEGAMFMLRWNDKKWGNNEYHYYGVGAFTLEVIGNIYENPNLLEGN